MAASSWGSPIMMHLSRPAATWNEAFPIGNGRLGAMVFGGVKSEKLVLNDITLWSGGPQEADRPGAAEALPQIQKLLLEGKNREAERLTVQNFVAKGRGSGYGNGAKDPFGSYEVLSTLDLEFPTAEFSDFRRTLDLDQAMNVVEYTQGGVKFTRRAIASFAEDVILLELTASKKGQISFQAKLSRPERASMEPHPTDLILGGQLENGTNGQGMKHQTRLRVVSSGGQQSTQNGLIKVENADRALLIISAGTDFRDYDNLGKIESRLNQAAKSSFNQQLAKHKKPYQALFHRVKLEIGDDDSSVDDQLRRFQRQTNGALPALYFHFGRYLLICSSRPGLLPANLQGLWADTVQTPWNGDYHLNINVQMNYWPAEVTQLSDVHEPLLDLIHSLVEPGKRTAKNYYNARGWVAHTITNVWGYTSPGEHPSWGAFMAASGWLCEHLWDHYDYTRDVSFLKKAYPTMKEAARFYMDVLIRDPKTGWLVTAPSNSPENSFKLANGEVNTLCLGPTMDSQIIRELLTNTAAAARILKVDAEFIAEMDRIKAQLPPTQIGKHGQIMEWLEDYEENEPRHRHVSPLYGLHPANQISPQKTPDLARAAEVTLERRGDASTGWSMAWKINFWARLGKGDRALKLMQDLLRPIGSQEYGFNYSNGGGTYVNLFDTHPPFQIDGNFGGCAAVAEMLLQSHLGEVHVLPALPKAWRKGSFDGLMARGGVIVGCDWSMGLARTVRLKAKVSGEVIVRRLPGSWSMQQNGAEKQLPDAELWTIRLRKGESVTLSQGSIKKG